MSFTDKVNLGSAIHGVRILLNEPAASVSGIGGASIRTSDTDILFMIKAWLHQSYQKTKNNFDGIEDVGLLTESLALPRPAEKADTRAIEGKEAGYPDLPIRASMIWDLCSGVFRFFNVRNESSVRPDQAQIIVQTRQNSEGRGR